MLNSRETKKLPENVGRRGNSPDGCGAAGKGKSGKDKLFGFFVGQAMKKTHGKANPQLLNDILSKLLSE